MAKQLKLRRGTTSQHSSFTGAEGEVTVDTTKDTLVVHDGSTAGGIPLAKESAAYTHPNHSGEVTSSADGAQTIADNVVDEANLKVSNSPTNGQYLQAQSGNTGGMTWATIPTADLTNLNASNLTSGTVPDARFPSTLPAASGVNLTALNATNLATGTVHPNRLPDGIKVNTSNTDATFYPIFMSGSAGNDTTMYTDGGQQLQYNPSTNVLTAGTFSGSGASLTNLPAAEGTAVLSTGETSNTKYLRADGDGTCSWQFLQTDNIKVQNESGDTECFPTFGKTATGDTIQLHSNTALKFNTANGALTATSFSGDGSALTNLPSSADPVCKHVYHSSSDTSWNLTVPSGVTKMRVYAVGHGGDGAMPTGGGYYCTSGAGAGFAYGDIAVVPGQTISFAVASKVATCTYGGTTLLTANPGADAVPNAQTYAAGGTASKHSSVTNGGAYSGGQGGYINATYGTGGGGAGSPLGSGSRAAKGGTGGIGCTGVWNSWSGGGAGSGSSGGGTDYVSGGAAPNQKARDGVIYPQFTDPLIKFCLNAGQVSFNQGINLYYFYESYSDTGVGGMYDNRGSGHRNHQNGGAFAGGGGGSQVTGGASVHAGNGGLLCGGGGTGGSTGWYVAGNGGYGGGGGGNRFTTGSGSAGNGGDCAFFVFY